MNWPSLVTPPQWHLRRSKGRTGPTVQPQTLVVIEGVLIKNTFKQGMQKETTQENGEAESWGAVQTRPNSIEAGFKATRGETSCSFKGSDPIRSCEQQVSEAVPRLKGQPTPPSCDGQPHPLEKRTEQKEKKSQAWQMHTKRIWIITPSAKHWRAEDTGDEPELQSTASPKHTVGSSRYHNGDVLQGRLEKSPELYHLSTKFNL